MESSSAAIVTYAVSLFLIANPIGNIPAIINLIKDFDFDTQKKIMIRETILTILIAFFFQYLGTLFLESLDIKKYTLSMCGGILNLLVALNMIFPKPQSVSSVTIKQIPILVPIATPLIAGPGVMTNIMLFSAEASNHFVISVSILIAWVGVSAILITAPYLHRVLGKRALVSIEQLMGLLLAMMSVEMLVRGTNLFIQSIQ